MNTDNANTQVVARVRMQRYRANHRRFDYIPSPDALVAIQKHRAIDSCLAGVIDQLILAGDKAISGNGISGSSNNYSKILPMVRQHL